jgi:hypothetical protein
MPEQRGYEYEIAVPMPVILKILGVSRSKFFRRYRVELQNAGVIFYRRQMLECVDGKKRIAKCIFAFPGRLERWVAVKSTKGEIL